MIIFYCYVRHILRHGIDSIQSDDNIHFDEIINKYNSWT